MPSLAEEFQLGLLSMRNMGARAKAFSDKSALQATTYQDAQFLTERLKTDKDELLRIRNMPGIAQYAKDVTGEPGADLNADYQALIDKCDDIFNIVDTSIPTSAAGYSEVISTNANGLWPVREFTSTQTASIRAECDLLVSLVPSWAYKQT